MSIDFPPPYPVNATPASSKSSDVQALQEAFAWALRSYGTEKGGAQTNSMLEVIRADPSDGANNQDRNQERREHQQQADRANFTQSDRRSLDKTEIQSSEMKADYQNRRERQEILRDDYRERVDSNEFQSSAVPTATSSPDTAKPNESLSNWNPLPSQQQRNVVEIAPVNVQSLLSSSAVPNSAANFGQTNAVLPINLNAPTSMPVVSQSVLLPTFTVFTPSGRFGQPQSQTDEKENEKEEESDEKIADKKKQQPFAALEAIRMETTRSIRRKPLRQQKESVSQPEISKIAEKPKEVESEQSRSVTTTGDLLDAPALNVTVQKKGEANQSNQQYLHRIAAACEAAAQHVAQNAPIRMKINLDHLGTLSLRFFHKADKLTLRFESSSRETAQFIRNHLDGLKTLLSERNVEIVDIEILEESL